MQKPASTAQWIRRAALLAAVALAGYLLSPVYGFYAHKGALPLPPTGWQPLPEDTPATHTHAATVTRESADAALARLAAHRDRIGAPAITAAVARGGEIVWTGAVGWADLKSHRPASADTAFRIGSTSKAVTATVFARLVDEKTLTPDTTVASLMTPLPNAAWSDITLRQLASHSAGLPHYKENTDLGGLYRSIALNRHYTDVRDAVSVFDSSDLLFEPGSDFSYSTLGTVLLGAALSDATDQTYRALVREHIARPLGLGSLAPAPRRGTADNGVATSYLVDGTRYRRWRPVDLSHRLPGGGFVATSSDLARLGSAWLDERYVSAPTRNEFWTHQALSDGTLNEQHYALGFRVSERDFDGVGTYLQANHGGVSRGAQSWLMIVPGLDLAVAININRKTERFGDFLEVDAALLRIFANDAAALKDASTL